MDIPPFEWYDYWRLAIIWVSILGLAILAKNWLTCRRDWDEWDKDRWFAMLMWFILALEQTCEGLLRDTGVRIALVFITAATLVTLRLITKNYSGSRQNA